MTVEQGNLFMRKFYILLSVISFTLPALLAVKNIKISPDSMRFALISQQLLLGHGIRVPIIRLEDNYTLIYGTVPFLDQMPFLPILFAILGGVTPDSYFPAQIINLISHIMTSLFTFLLMRRIHNNINIAMLAGLLVSTTFPLLNLTQHMLSEPLFLALITASIYSLILSRDKGNKYYIISTFLTCLAILTRNAGIAIIPLFLFESFNMYRSRKGFLIPIASSLLPIITATLLFLRNYLLSGNIRGFNYPPVERTLQEAFIGTIKMIFLQFQLGSLSTTAIVLLLVLFMPFIVICIRKIGKGFYHSGLDLIILFVISYTILVIFTMAKSQYLFEVRYVSPLVPFLFILFIYLIIIVGETLNLWGFYETARIWLATSLLMLTIGNAYKTVLNIPTFSYKQKGHYEILNLCTYKWVKEHIPEDAIITTNRAYHLSFFGGYSTVALPHKRFDPRIYVPDDMESLLPKRMEHLGSQFVVLFKTAEEGYEGKYIARLFTNRKSDENFDLIYECADGVIYKLKNKT